MNERIIELYLILFYIMLNHILTMCSYHSMTTNFTRFLVSLVVFPLLFPIAISETIHHRHDYWHGYGLRRIYRSGIDNFLMGIGKLVMFIWTKTRLKFSKKERLQKEWDELFYCGE